MVFTMDVVFGQNEAHIIWTGPTFTGTPTAVSSPRAAISWQAAAIGLRYCTSGLREEGLDSFTHTQLNPDFTPTQFNITLYQGILTSPCTWPDPWMPPRQWWLIHSSIGSVFYLRPPILKSSTISLSSIACLSPSRSTSLSRGPSLDLASSPSQ